MIERRTLPNGVRIIYEHLDHVRSAAIGIWVGTGSRFESKTENGSAHFIEHMLFKGTAARSAQDIAMEMDAVGGQMNAYTTKEHTCFYARVLDTHLGTALDVLSDMFFNSKFDEGDVASERNVILEEIGMYEDTPEDLVAERLFGAVFKGSPLGRPILGFPRALKGMTGESLKRYKVDNYSPRDTVIALCGSFDDAAVDELAARFSGMREVKPRKCRAAVYAPAFTLKRRAIEQNHVILAFPGITSSSPDRYAVRILSAILGNSSSSRLFQSVREERGLCYAIYSFGSSHSDTGVFGVYTALGRETEAEALRLIAGEIRRFKENGVTADELYRAREQIKANVLMGQESTSARLSTLGRGMLLMDRVIDQDELTALYDAVTAEDISRLAGEMLDFDRISLSAVGRVGSGEYYRELLA